MVTNDLPRILGVAPELAYWPDSPSMQLKFRGKDFTHYPKKRMDPKGGGLGDVTPTLYIALRELGVNVGFTLPHFPKIANLQRNISSEEVQQMKVIGELIEEDETKLRDAGFVNGSAEHSWDRNFFPVDHPNFHNLRRVYGGDGIVTSLTFQRAVLNEVIPEFKPDLIHTHDWMTGLIGTLCHQDIKTLHTLHNFHDNPRQVSKELLSIWGFPMYNHERLFLGEGKNPRDVRFQLSGLAGCNAVNTPSNGFLRDSLRGDVPDEVNPHFVVQLNYKSKLGMAFGVVNAPDPSYSPEIDPALYQNFSLGDVVEGKVANKLQFQNELRLKTDSSAALLLWPNRADPAQKGPQHLDNILPGLMEHFQNPEVQIAIVADGPYIPIFKRTRDELVKQGFGGRISVTRFSDEMERRGYAAADGVLVPSLYEPCGLAQLKGPKYGCIPIVRNTGGLGETVKPIRDGGHGVVFEDYDANGLWWAVNEFLSYHHSPCFGRIVRDAKRYADENFTVEKMAEGYIRIYETLLGRRITK